MNTHMRVTSRKTLKLFTMKIQIVLGLGKCSNAEILIDGENYITCMIDNPNFTSVTITEALTAGKDNAF